MLQGPKFSPNIELVVKTEGAVPDQEQVGTYASDPAGLALDMYPSTENSRWPESDQAPLVHPVSMGASVIVKGPADSAYKAFVNAVVQWRQKLHATKPAADLEFQANNYQHQAEQLDILERSGANPAGLQRAKDRLKEMGGQIHDFIQGLRNEKIVEPLLEEVERAAKVFIPTR